MTEPCVVEQKVPQILNICFSHSLTPSYTAWDRSHMMSSLGEGVEGDEVSADDEVSYFSYGKYNSNIADEGGGGIQRAIFGMTSYMNAHQVADLT